MYCRHLIVDTLFQTLYFRHCLQTLYFRLVYRHLIPETLYRHSMTDTCLLMLLMISVRLWRGDTSPQALKKRKRVNLPTAVGSFTPFCVVSESVASPCLVRLYISSGSVHSCATWSAFFVWQATLQNMPDAIELKNFPSRATAGCSLHDSGRTLKILLYCQKRTLYYP